MVSEPKKPSLISPYFCSEKLFTKFPGLYAEILAISLGVKLCSFISHVENSA